MKMIKLIGLALGCIMIGLSACNNGTDEPPMSGNVIRLIGKIVSSRVVDQDYQSEQIVIGRHVGITISGTDSEHENVAWIVGNGGFLTNVGPDVYWDNTDATITAYHPYHAGWTGNNHVFSVNTDQSTDEGYLDSDLLWVKTTASSSDDPVTLTFMHKLAKINVALSSDDISDLSDATITICGTNISTGFNPETGTLFAAENKVADIKASVTTPTAYTASAIIVPQKVINGTRLVKVTYKDEDYYYQLSADMEFKSGYSYQYSLKMKKADGGGPSIGIVFEEGEMNGSDYEFGF